MYAGEPIGPARLTVKNNAVINVEPLNVYISAEDLKDRYYWKTVPEMFDEIMKHYLSDCEKVKEGSPYEYSIRVKYNPVYHYPEKVEYSHAPISGETPDGAWADRELRDLRPGK